MLERTLKEFLKAFPLPFPVKLITDQNANSLFVSQTVHRSLGITGEVFLPERRLRELTSEYIQAGNIPRDGFVEVYASSEPLLLHELFHVYTYHLFPDYPSPAHNYVYLCEASPSLILTYFTKEPRLALIFFHASVLVAVNHLADAWLYFTLRRMANSMSERQLKLLRKFVECEVKYEMERPISREALAEFASTLGYIVGDAGVPVAMLTWLTPVLATEELLKLAEAVECSVEGAVKVYENRRSSVPIGRLLRILDDVRDIILRTFDTYLDHYRTLWEATATILKKLFSVVGLSLVFTISVRRERDRVLIHARFE